MVLQEITFQTVIDGVFLKLAVARRKCWPKFPLNLGFLTLQNSIHAAILGKAIADMSLGEVPRRMHDPEEFLENHFVQEHTKIVYAHQEFPNDFIYIGATYFSEVVSRISTLLEKTHIFHYQKDLKTTVLHFK